MTDNPFGSEENLHNAFVSGLDGLGVFILVCANAGFDARIWTRLEGKLRQRYARHAEQYRQLLQDGSSLPDAEDDVAVFLKIMDLGFEALELTEQRQAGPWEIQFNQLRSFRPPRMAHQRVDSLQAPFNDSGFHFNKPFLRKECFWQGGLEGREVELLYNKFPFVENHALLVPQRERNAPQYLTPDDHCYLWQVCERLGETLSGVGFGYNAYGAYSSINHLHFQMFQRHSELPLQLSQWLHNGGKQQYPTECLRFTDVEQAWRRIESLHRNNTAYNLLYLPGRLYCLPRRMQGSYRHAPWTGGFAWYEMCGGMVTFNREHYNGLRAEDIEQELAVVRPPVTGSEFTASDLS